MDGVNMAVLMGHLGSDPELRYANSGRPLLLFRMATTTTYFDKSQNTKKQNTNWHNVVTWGNSAEQLHKFLRKGHLVHVVGYIKNSSWETDNGERRYKTEVVANKVNVINRLDDNGAPREPRQHRQGNKDASSVEKQASLPTDSYYDDDDIPF